MTTSLSTPASVVNANLSRVVGYKQFVGHLHDGSMAARDSPNLRSDPRPTMLKAVTGISAAQPQRSPCSSPLRRAATSRFHAVGTRRPTAAGPYKFEYVYPDDCLGCARCVRPDLRQHADAAPWPFGSRTTTPTRRRAASC